MKYLVNFFALTLVAILLFPSCDRDNLDEVNIAEPPPFVPETVTINNLISALQSNTETGLDLECVQVVYPFDLLRQSGDAVTINNVSAYELALAGVASELVVDFVFPLTINDEEGNTLNVTDNEVLGKRFASCLPSSGWEKSLTTTTELIPAFLLDNYCLSLVYPVELEDGEGNRYTAEDETELVDLCAQIEELFFVLPFTVIDQSGADVVIENTDAFFAAIFECRSTDPPLAIGDFVFQGFACNRLLYPVDVQTVDGVVTLADENEYVALLLSGVEGELILPISLETQEGEVISITNQEDLIAAYALCGITIIIGPADTCDVSAHILLFFNQGASMCGYNLQFPLQLEAEGTTYDIETEEDYFALFNTGVEINVIYPVSVTIIEDGSTLNFESDEEVCAFIDACG